MEPEKTLKDLWKIKEKLYQEKKKSGLSLGEWLAELEKRADNFIERSGYRIIEISKGMSKITR